jgi:hypothetical protein
VGGAGEPVQNDSRVCRIRYSCVGAPVPLVAAAERATDWIRRNTASPALTPASPMRAGRGIAPAVAGMRCRSAGPVCRLGAATPAARRAPTRIAAFAAEATGELENERASLPGGQAVWGRSIVKRRQRGARRRLVGPSPPKTGCSPYRSGHPLFNEYEPDSIGYDSFR